MFRQQGVILRDSSERNCFVMDSWGWHLVVETYVGVFKIHYILMISSDFVGCYEDCDKMDGVILKKWIFICPFYQRLWCIETLGGNKTMVPVLVVLLLIYLRFLYPNDLPVRDFLTTAYNTLFAKPPPKITKILNTLHMTFPPRKHYTAYGSLLRSLGTITRLSSSLVFSQCTQ
jgi:hypothetical protein